MRTCTYLIVALFAVACSKKSDEQPAPQPAPKTVSADSAKKTPAVAAAAKLVTVTTKSPEAGTAFAQAQTLVFGSRGSEAIEALNKAISLDSDFAMAHAYLGQVVPGADGMAELDKAVALAAKLPDPERMTIEGMRAMRAGEHDKAIAAYQKVIELAPDDWHTMVALGTDANFNGDYAGAIKYFEQASKVKPDLAIAQNGMAYGNAGLRQWDPAIAAAKKQAELLPKEPNPADTLGEILMLAGKFDDSEKAFQQALALEPKFDISWQGVAFARAYRGDFKGALEANTKQKAAATTANDRVGTELDAAWLALASGKPADAVAQLDAIEKDPEAAKTPSFAFAALDRAYILQLSGKVSESAKALADALTRADALPGGAKRTAMRRHAIGSLRLAALTGKAAADADKLVAVTEDGATTPATKSIVSWAHGLAAWAKTGPKDAVAELSKCDRQLAGCQLDLALAQRKAGDTAGAEATEKAIRETTQRDPVAVYAVSQLPKK
jgi:tetratricopeptide (TPR) repeat protein